MSLPQFSAEASLASAKGRYVPKPVASRPGVNEVLPMQISGAGMSSRCCSWTFPHRCISFWVPPLYECECIFPGPGVYCHQRVIKGGCWGATRLARHAKQRYIAVRGFRAWQTGRPGCGATHLLNSSMVSCAGRTAVNGLSVRKRRQNRETKNQMPYSSPTLYLGHPQLESSGGFCPRRPKLRSKGLSGNN